MEQLFTYFTGRVGEDRKVVQKRFALSFWFLESFPETEFKGIERYFYQALQQAVDLETPMNERFLDTFIKSELKSIIARTKEKVPGTETMVFEDIIQLETAVRIVGDLMRESYIELLSYDSDFDNFLPDASEFMGLRLQSQVLDLMSTSYEMLNTMTNKRIGPQDTIEFMNFRTQMIMEIYDKAKLESIGDISALYTENEDGEVEVNAKQVFELSFDTGITGLDKDMKGIYTTQLIGVEAAPGMGKTKFAVSVLNYRAATAFKKNTWFGSLEQTVPEIEAMFLSIHIFHLFNKQVSSFDIARGALTPEMQRLKDIAYEDLFKSGKYGKILIEECDLFIETFVNKFKMIDVLHGGVDVFTVDYMALMQQAPAKPGEYKAVMTDWKIIQLAYRRFKAFCRQKRKVGIAVNQLNREGITKSKAGQLTDQNDAQGGIEVYRNTDYNIVISATEEMEAMRIRRLTNPKKRNADGLGELLVNVRLAFGYWYDKVKTL